MIRIYAQIEVVRSSSKARNAGAVSIRGNYRLFALLANVRNDPRFGIDGPVYPPKGLPADVSYSTNVRYTAGLCDELQGASWLSLEELEEVQHHYADLPDMSSLPSDAEVYRPEGLSPTSHLRAYVTSTGHGGFIHAASKKLGPNSDLEDVIERMKALTHRGAPRLVFWFI